MLRTRDPMRATSMGDRASAHFSVTENTTPHLDFAQDLDAYVAGGADGIGIFEIKLTDDRANRELLVASGLRASSGFLAAGSILPGPLAPGPDDPSERVRDLAVGIRRLAALGAPFCLLSTGPSRGHDATEATSIVARGLRDLARVAADEGVGIVLEMMHPSLARSSASCTHFLRPLSYWTRSVPPILGLRSTFGRWVIVQK